MLRRAQPQQQLQQDKKSGGGGVAAPRSLEALLAESTGAGVSADPAAAESGDGGRRCSVSSDWSPAPPSAVKLGLSHSRGGGGGGSSNSRRRGRSDLGTPETAAVAGGAVTGMSAWRSACSTPPTPARMSFEKEDRWTPGGETPEAAATGNRYAP